MEYVLFRPILLSAMRGIVTTLGVVSVAVLLYTISMR